MIRRFKEPVPQEVKENVRKYLTENNLGELVDVTRHSDHPDDHYLYHVIAKKGEDNYCCFTSWNETTQSLNFGHYNLVSEEVAREVANKFFYRIEDPNVID